MEDLVGAEFVPESYGNFWEFWRETPVRPNPARVDRVNVLVVRYVTRQPELILIVGYGKDGAGRQTKQ
jgi:hypothetical protein